MTDMTVSMAKTILRENEMPMFEDEVIEDFLKKENGLYELLILKSENTSIQITGMTTADTSDYFRRLASLYRDGNSGVLKSAI